MRIEDNVAIMAAVIMATVSAAALLPRDMFREGLAELPTRVASQLAPLNTVNQDLVAGQAQPLPAAAQTVVAATVKPGAVKLEQAPRVRFTGVVQQISELPEQDGQIHVWLETANKKELRVSVAPSWFLKYTGCELAHDSTVSGIGFRFDAVGPDPLIYARKLQINGRTCQLRNDEGFALWSNRLR